LWADGRIESAKSNESVEHFEMARQFVCLFGGTLDVFTGGEEADVVATMVLPVVEQTTVLVVEDNADTLQLLERYLAGTRYHFVGTRHPEQALSLVEEINLHIVLLDIMLPGIDGWELLGRLREHPRLSDVPIVVSTILPQEKLALTLGAADFIRKPFRRETLLEVLERQRQRGGVPPTLSRQRL
jgi:CheY-like chemotaxis protein